ncbi:MAG: response regulator transcription factor [Candidatus Eremiobacteraeota bacterium]|nr:response regulator transcription factor [Candidatus Eremiobacteraeota bacterium]
MKILIIEDNVSLAEVLRRGLAEAGHVVDVESDGLRGEIIAAQNQYDAMILDVMLPAKDGLAVARALRNAGVRTPILMLTSRDTTEDIISGLDAGADDYLRKPFVFAEVEARLRSITRRDPPATTNELSVGDLSMDLMSRKVQRGGTLIPLSARETAFLEYFMRNAGLLLTRPMLEDALWEMHRDTTSNIIEVYVRRLRSKLSPNGEPSLLHTVRGAGYRFATADDV